MKKITIGMIILAIFLVSTIFPVLVNATYITTNKLNNKIIVKDSFNMIIIAPSGYNNALEPFVEHKDSLGIITKFVSLDDIYAGKYFSVQGRDNQEKIKYFIKDAIETWGITYVLFVGNFKQVPVRYCYNDDNYSSFPEPKFVSELYYADIYDENRDFSSWDTDGDLIFGEWDDEVAEDRLIDLTPDVCLGRLACANVNEIIIVVNKIINYEGQTADPSWFKRMVVVGGDTYQEFEGYEGEIYNQQAVDAMEGFTPVKLWASTGALKTGKDIAREINKGCGFWYLSGHGASSVWVTYTPPPDRRPVGNFNAFNILSLSNKYKLPVCVVGGCHNSEFAVSAKTSTKALNLFAWLRECWSWQLVSKPNGGSIATIGPTGLAWYSAEYDGEGVNWLNVQFFKEYANDTVVLGQIWKKALTHYLENNTIDWETPFGSADSIDAKTAQEWTLLGDPSLTIGGSNEKPFSKNR